MNNNDCSYNNSKNIETNKSINFFIIMRAPRMRPQNIPHTYNNNTNKFKYSKIWTYIWTVYIAL